MKSIKREMQSPVHTASPLTDDSSNTVQITLTHDELSSASDLGAKVADGAKVALSLSFSNGEAAQNVTPTSGAEPSTHFSVSGTGTAASSAASPARGSRLGTWLLPVIFVIALYCISHPKWVRGFVAQTGKGSSEQVRADMASTPQKAEAAAAVADVQPKDETAMPEEASAPEDRVVRPAAPTMEIQKVSEAKPLKSKNGLMVPPPPPAPCVLPPSFDFFLAQPGQQSAEHQQGLQQPASGRTDGTPSAAEIVAEQKRLEADKELQAADQKLDEALRSSLHTVGEWTH